MVSHEQRNIKYILIKLEIVKRKTQQEFYLIREKLLEFFERLDADILLGFEFTRKNVVVSLD